MLILGAGVKADDRLNRLDALHDEILVSRHFDRLVGILVGNAGGDNNHASASPTMMSPGKTGASPQPMGR